MKKIHYTNIFVLYTFYAVLLVGSKCTLPDLNLFPLSTSTGNTGDHFMAYLRVDYFPRLTSVVDIKSANQKLFLTSLNPIATTTYSNGLRLYRNDGRLVGMATTIANPGYSYYSNTNSRLIVNALELSTSYHCTVIHTIQSNQGQYTFSNVIYYGYQNTIRASMTLGTDDSTVMIMIGTLYLWKMEIVGNVLVHKMITQLPNVQSFFTDASIYKTDFVLVSVNNGRLFVNTKSDFTLLQTWYYDEGIDFFFLDKSNNDIAFMSSSLLTSKRLSKYNVANKTLLLFTNLDLSVKQFSLKPTQFGEFNYIILIPNGYTWPVYSPPDYLYFLDKDTLSVERKIDLKASNSCGFLNPWSRDIGIIQEGKKYYIPGVWLQYNCSPFTLYSQNFNTYFINVTGQTVGGSRLLTESTVAYQFNQTNQSNQTSNQQDSTSQSENQKTQLHHQGIIMDKSYI